VMPFLMQFALNQEVNATDGGVGIAYQGRISEYADTITTLILAFGACFQLPVIQVILGRAGIVSSQAWFNGGKYAIVGIFVLAAFLTPPDIVSQVVLGVPMVVLYYVGAGIVRLIEKRQDKENPAV
jgi:sec-independent protein translocase protein TatC